MPSWAGLTHPRVLSGKPPENQLCSRGLFGTSSLHMFSKLPVERYLHLTRWMGATLPLRCLCWDGRATSWCRRDPAASYRLITVESYRLYHAWMQLRFTYLQLILFLDTRHKQIQTRNTLVGTLSHLGVHYMCFRSRRRFFFLFYFYQKDLKQKSCNEEWNSRLNDNYIWNTVWCWHQLLTCWDIYFFFVSRQVDRTKI